MSLILLIIFRSGWRHFLSEFRCLNILQTIQIWYRIRRLTSTVCNNFFLVNYTLLFCAESKFFSPNPPCRFLLQGLWLVLWNARTIVFLNILMLFFSLLFFIFFLSLKIKKMKNKIKKMKNVPSLDALFFFFFKFFDQ